MFEECLKVDLTQNDEPFLLRQAAGSVEDDSGGLGSTWQSPSKQLEDRQSSLPTSNLPAICWEKAPQDLIKVLWLAQPSAPSPEGAPQNFQVSTSPRPRLFLQSLSAYGGHRWPAAPSPWKRLQSGSSRNTTVRSQHKHQTSYAKKRKLRVSQVSLSCF